MELVGETMRYALNRLAVAAPAWLQTHLHPAWGDRYRHRVENYRLPKTEAERQQLAATIGADGFTLLRAAYAPEAPRQAATLQAGVRARLAAHVDRALTCPARVNAIKGWVPG